MAQLAKDDRIVTPTSAEEEAALRADGYVDLVDYVFPPGDSLARHFSTGERAALRKELGGGGGGSANLWDGATAEYDALATKDPNTWYGTTD